LKALLSTNALWYPLRFPAEFFDPQTHEKKKINTSIFHYHYPTAEDMQQILSLRTFRDFGGGSFYDDSFGFLDQNPHNTMHIWTGGQNPDAGQATYVCKDAPTAAAASQSDAETTRLRALAKRRNDAVQVGGRRFHARPDLYSQPRSGDMFSNL